MPRRGQEDGRRDDRPPKKERASERDREDERRREEKRERRAAKKEKREAKRELKAERDRAYWGDPDLWDDRPQKTQGFFLSSRNVQPKKRTVALVLCLFFGWCGAHRFYLGQKGIGAFYVVLMIISIFSVFGDFIAPIIVVFWVLDLICLIVARS